MKDTDNDLVTLHETIVNQYDEPKQTYFDDAGTAHKELKRVADKYVGDPEVDPLAGLHQQILDGRGKHPLPAAHIFLSQIYRSMRAEMLKRFDKDGNIPKHTIKEMLDFCLQGYALQIKDKFTIKKEAYEDILANSIEYAAHLSKSK